VTLREQKANHRKKKKKVTKVEKENKDCSHNYLKNNPVLMYNLFDYLFLKKFIFHFYSRIDKH